MRNGLLAPARGQRTGDSMTALQASSQEELRRVIDRLERLSEEIAELKADFNDTLKNAGQKGFDAKIIRRVLSIRKKDRGEYDEEQAVLDTYLHALSGTPMGDYIAKQDAKQQEAQVPA